MMSWKQLHFHFIVISVSTRPEHGGDSCLKGELPDRSVISH